MSLPRPFAVGQFGVATWSFEVATWGRLPGRVTTSKRATCAGCARDMRHRSVVRSATPTTWALRARPGFLVCALCTQPSFVTVHCLGSLFGYCSWTLFMSTVHRVKKKEYKNFKNFLVYDLKNEIFILKLL